MNAISNRIRRYGGALMLAWACVPASGQAPVIAAFDQNGLLVCTNLKAGSTASVEWASSVRGPWTNTWAGLEAVLADSNGVIRVSVPVFFRVRGVPADPVVPAPVDMAWIPAGSLTIGDTFTEGNSGELPPHTVSVSAFYMDKHEVTLAKWEGVYLWAVAHGYRFNFYPTGKADNHPAQLMTWYDAVKWCNARSEQEGRVPAYYTSAEQTNVYRSGEVGVEDAWVKWDAGYRLPTEAEWEKAARGGQEGRRFPWGEADTITHDRANYFSDSSDAYDTSPTRDFHPDFQTGALPYTSPVGYFAANGYGLYDMAGNVFEWCWDWYEGSYYSTSPTTNPRGPSGALRRVLRGGCWTHDASYCRTASRISYWPDGRNNFSGFRTVLPPSPP